MPAGFAACRHDGGGRWMLAIDPVDVPLHGSCRDHIFMVKDDVLDSTSSTLVRRELAAGRSVRYLLPDSVIAYIQQHGLYGTAAD